MTKIEIIDDTVAYYTSHRRSVIEEGQCMYLGPNGELCAFSRCCTDVTPLVEFDKNMIESGIGTSAGGVLQELSDTILKDEYRGHDAGFWENIQRLHDNPEYWNSEGENNSLTEVGEEIVAMLKNLYSSN